MSLHPAQQEKTPAPKKRTSKRGARSATSAKQHAASESSAGADASDAPDAEAAQVSAPVPAVAPNFVRRDLTAPDGSVRPGWEMWIGDHCFGRADSKELLLASFERLQSPPSSFHWREVRNRMPMRGRPKATTPQPEEDEESAPSAITPPAAAAEDSNESWAWEKESKEPLVEEQEGFQEMTWENPA